eukprot:TRINITY_DN35686_c0_g1_i2.p1 TRINITY_DN35686_c0_g1~~TRINITY_DN35686_c0_g1_i2.p1  ORF type:complete len:123 (-),score=57.38 TRINITY_DN35686_c0_g1_i2:58-426(-)
MIFFFQAEDGIRDAQESRGLGDVYKRQHYYHYNNSTHNYHYNNSTHYYHNNNHHPDYHNIGNQCYDHNNNGADYNHYPTHDNHHSSTHHFVNPHTCLLYTSDAADEEDSVDFGGRRIFKKKE